MVATRHAAGLRKSAVGVSYVYIVYLLCYLPQTCDFAVVAICHLNVGFHRLVVSQFVFKPCYLLLEDEMMMTMAFILKR